MSPAVLALVAAAAVLHASWNLVSKRAADAGATFVFFYRMWAVVLYLPWALYVVIQSGPHWSGLALAALAFSTVLHLVYNLTLMNGYRVADLSIVYPVARGTGPLLASVAAIVALGESPGRGKSIGIGAVVLGIFTMASQGQWRMFLQKDAWPGVRWGIITGTLIAAYSLADAWAVKTLLIAPVLLDWISSLGGSVLLAPVVWKRRDAVRSLMHGRWLMAFYVGLASPLAYILVLYALHLGAEVSQVAPLRESSMVVATLAGAWLLKESVGLARWAGCGMILLGVVLIALGS